jgi:hypothetical protein
MTGRKVTHMIDPDGPFAVALANLMPFDIPYFTMPVQAAAKAKDKSKVKTSCPCCDTKAWCKQGTRIICSDCNELMVQEG